MKIKRLFAFLSMLIAACMLLSSCIIPEPEPSGEIGGDKEVTAEQFNSVIAMTRAHIHNSAKTLRVVYTDTIVGDAPVEASTDVTYSGSWVRIKGTRGDAAETVYYQQNLDSTYSLYEYIEQSWTLTDPDADMDYGRANNTKMVDLVKAIKSMTAFADSKYTVKSDRLDDFTLAYAKTILEYDTDESAQAWQEYWSGAFTDAYFKIGNGKISELYVSKQLYVDEAVTPEERPEEEAAPEEDDIPEKRAEGLSANKTREIDESTRTEFYYDRIDITLPQEEEPGEGMTAAQFAEVIQNSKGYVSGNQYFEINETSESTIMGQTAQSQMKFAVCGNIRFRQGQSEAAGTTLKVHEYYDISGDTIYRYVESAQPGVFNKSLCEEITLEIETMLALQENFVLMLDFFEDIFKYTEYKNGAYTTISGKSAEVLAAYRLAAVKMVGAELGEYLGIYNSISVSSTVLNGRIGGMKIIMSAGDFMGAGGLTVVTTDVYSYDPAKQLTLPAVL